MIKEDEKKHLNRLKTSSAKFEEEENDKLLLERRKMLKGILNIKNTVSILCYVTPLCKLPVHIEYLSSENTQVISMSIRRACKINFGKLLTCLTNTFIQVISLVWFKNMFLQIFL